MAKSKIEQRMKLNRDIASFLYPRPIGILDVLNGHARLKRWLKHQTAPVFAERFQLYDHIESTYLAGEAINYLEFGVHNGESFHRWLEIEIDPNSRFWGFDTFTGLPTEWNKYRPSGHFDVEGQLPTINDTRANFVVGLFQDTLPGFLKEFKNDNRLVIHNDSDLYSSTHYTLGMLNDFIRPGTIIIFDEFASPLHEYRAWHDYCDAYMRSAKLIGTAGAYAEQAAFLFE